MQLGAPGLATRSKDATSCVMFMSFRLALRSQCDPNAAALLVLRRCMSMPIE